MKELEHSVLQVRVAESEYLHLYDETKKLMQRLGAGFFCAGEMVQRLISASDNVLGCRDVIHVKAAKSRNTVMGLLLGNFASFVQRLQTLFTQEIAEISKSFHDSGHEPLSMVCESIFECEAAA